jgi:hypothetical protein
MKDTVEIDTSSIVRFFQADRLLVKDLIERKGIQRFGVLGVEMAQVQTQFPVIHLARL